jgi:hypothetical protein
LSATHTDTVAAAPVAGDLIVGITVGEAVKWSKLAVPDIAGPDRTGMSLTIDLLGAPVWSKFSLLDAREHIDSADSGVSAAGDMIVMTPGIDEQLVWQRLVVGDEGDVLTVKDGVVSWEAPPSIDDLLPTCPDAPGVEYQLKRVDGVMSWVEIADWACP